MIGLEAKNLDFSEEISSETINILQDRINKSNSLYEKNINNIKYN
ncbi:hypothetical protein ThvES_00002170 [Thiovulum sp. ES]|nr:hypothetical protein ThvES_00002170 [Thiovulum sp. ES]